MPLDPRVSFILQLGYRPSEEPHVDLECRNGRLIAGRVMYCVSEWVPHFHMWQYDRPEIGGGS